MTAGGAPAPHTIRSMRVAFLGLGIMGSRMAVHLVGAGHEVTVWTRTAGKAAGVGGRARRRAPPTAGARPPDGAEAVISMVVDGPQVEAVLLGPDGAAQAAPARARCSSTCRRSPRRAALAIGADARSGSATASSTPR